MTASIVALAGAAILTLKAVTAEGMRPEGNLS
jgi:hypothetical protein